MTEHPISPVPPDEGPHEGAGVPAWDNGHPQGMEQQRGAPFDPEEQTGFDWRPYVAAFLRYKWLILLGGLLGVGGAYLVWEEYEPEFVATGSLWIQSDARGDRGPIQTDGVLRGTSWLDLVHTNAVLDSVVQQEKLYLSTARPEDFDLLSGLELAEQFVPGSYVLRVSEDGAQVSLLRDRSVLDRAAPGEAIGEELGFRWILPEQGLRPDQEIPFSVSRPRAAASRLRGELTTQLDRQGAFIRVSWRGPDPDRVAAVVNGVMARHVALAAELKSGHLDEQTEILRRQLEQVSRELEEAEQALESFRVQTVTLPSEERAAVQPGLEMTRAPVFAEYFRMRGEQDDRRRDIRRIENVLASLEDGEFPVEAVELISTARVSSQIQEGLASLVAARTERRELMNRYTAEHPQVIETTERIRTLEERQLPALLTELLAQLRREDEAMERRIADSGADLSEIPPRAIEEARLRRQVVIAESLYTDLRGRYEVAALARASSIPDIRILDHAEPSDSPTNDQRVRRAAMILVGFLGAGFAGAILLDRMDRRIRTPDEASRAAGLLVLGAVPRLRWTKGKKGTRNMNQVYEAFRELRTNLEYAYGSAGPMVVTLSSPSAEEGKTLVTTNLGIAFAGLNRKTLVIDGDTRRGDLHHYLEGRRKPGLVDYLRSTNGHQEIVQSTAYPGLHFIGSGTHVPNSPELLSSARMRQLMGQLRKEYDVILMDSPPLAAGSDPLVLSSLTGHMVLVVRSGSTNRDLTQAKIEPLYRLPIRLLGVVLNDFVPERMSSSYKYYGSYLPDYEAGAETEEDETGRMDPAKRIVGAGAKADE